MQMTSEVTCEYIICSDLRLCTIYVCQHGGTCFFYGNTIGCLCIPGFTGRFCEDAVQQMHNTCNIFFITRHYNNNNIKLISF